MVERYDGERLPPVHPVQDGRPPLPDGQGLPQPPQHLPLATREFVWGAIAAVIVLALLVTGIVRSL
jgi:hypothetical protein